MELLQSLKCVLEGMKRVHDQELIAAIQSQGEIEAMEWRELGEYDGERLRNAVIALFGRCRNSHTEQAESIRRMIDLIEKDADNRSSVIGRLTERSVN